MLYGACCYLCCMLFQVAVNIISFGVLLDSEHKPLLDVATSMYNLQNISSVRRVVGLVLVARVTISS